MQRYHLNSEGIPGYINELKGAQSKAKRVNNPITNARLVIILTNVMLSTEQLPQSNEY